MRVPFDGNYPLNLDNPFGANPDLYKQFMVSQPDGTVGPLKGHNGLDFCCPTGTRILAPHDGTIIEAALDPTGYGSYVKIENDKEGSVLAHLQSITVKVGYIIKEGEEIGISDSTGNSTGPHLHWGYYTKPRDRANGYYGFIDQSALIGIKPSVPVITQESPDPVVTPPPAMVVSTEKIYTEEEYDAAMKDRQTFWEERDAARVERDEALKKLGASEMEGSAANAKLSAFNALGYKSVDDVLSVVKKSNDERDGCLQQLTQVLERNRVLAELLAKKETEDATAIDSGWQAIKELKLLKDDMASIGKATGVKPDVTHIIDHFRVITKMVQDTLKKSNKDGVPVNPAEPIPSSPKNFFWNAILAPLGLGGVISALIILFLIGARWLPVLAFR